MSVGLGIFLGLFFCGVIFLYSQTKDRWNWGKGRNILLCLVGIPIALGLIVAGVVFLNEIYEKQPQVITTLKGIQLGEKLQDVIFKHGKPDRESVQYARLLGIELKHSKKDKGSQEYKELNDQYTNAKKEAEEALAGKEDGRYAYTDKYTGFKIKNGKVEWVSYSCKSDDVDYTSLNGIRCGDKGNKIFNEFGSNVRVLCSAHKKDFSDLMRAYDVVEYGTRYVLVRNSVVMLTIAAPDELESFVDRNWIPCD
ncbi:hypothetical protein ACFL3K_01295 [Pseudomonadota bacterium]